MRPMARRANNKLDEHQHEVVHAQFAFRHCSRMESMMNECPKTIHRSQGDRGNKDWSDFAQDGGLVLGKISGRICDAVLGNGIRLQQLQTKPGILAASDVQASSASLPPFLLLLILRERCECDDKCHGNLLHDNSTFSIQDTTTSSVEVRCPRRRESFNIYC